MTAKRSTLNEVQQEIYIFSYDIKRYLRVTAKRSTLNEVEQQIYIYSVMILNATLG